MLTRTFNTPAKYYKNLNRCWVIRKSL